MMPEKPSPRAGEAIRRATAALAEITDTPRLDAELLMAHALGMTREDLLLRHLDAPAPAAFTSLLDRRLAREPLAYITGTRDFWTITLAVAPGVLIPRPDSETLIEAAVGHFGKAGPRTVLDLGTGSGALLLAALAQWPEATGLGVDASPVALAVAARNAEALGLAPRARFQSGDWGQGLSTRFDLILCNPPYVEAEADLAPEVRDHEPASALFAGPDGLDDYRRLIPQLPALLAPGGIACVEIGHMQAEAVRAIAQECRLHATLRHDLAGRARCLVLSAPA
jgi:release factor glutamine methyltransferase